LHYWRNDGTPQSPNFVQVTQSYLTFDAGEITQPLLIDIDHDGDLDLFFMTNANLGWMKNIGTSQSPSFQVQSYNLLNLPAGSFTFAYLDSDAYPDLITAAGWSGVLSFWHTVVNGGQVSFQFISSMNTSYHPGIGMITAGDIDADGVDELLVGGFDYSPGDGVLALYENQGYLGHPNFVFQTANYQGLVDSLLWLTPGISPYLSDVDMDGKLDLIFGGVPDFIYYHNIGTPQQPIFVLITTSLFGFTTNPEALISGGDIDADGDWDAFLGTYRGGLLFFRNVTGESPVNPDPKYHPQPERQISILPNPGNSGTTISYVLSHPQHVNLSVYNLLGSRLVTLVDGLQQPGSHATSWDATWKASGIYLVRFNSPELTTTQKVVIQK
jgi:hypothetical protein